MTPVPVATAPHAEATDAEARGARRRAWFSRGAGLLASVALYVAAFLPLHDLFGRPAFSLSVVPAVVGGFLLGPGGVVASVVLVDLANSQFAAIVRIPPDEILPSAVLSTAASVGLGMGVAMLVRLLAVRRETNRKLEAEVAARRATELALGRSAHLHQALVETLGEGVALFDATERCVFANQEVARVMGVPLEQFLGQPFERWWDPETRERLLEQGPSSRSGRRCYEVTLAPPGRRTLLVTETRWSSDDDTGARTLRVLRDVTDRVELEQQRRRIEIELERGQALQSLAVLAGGVAHDFNNLLGGVVGNAELALLKLPPDTPPVVREILRELSEFALEAGQLSQRMLAYAGRRAASPEPLDLNREVEESLHLLHSTIEAKARLERNLDPELPLLFADQIQLRQLVTNLVLNALEAMRGQRGRLRLASARLPLDVATLAARGAPSGSIPGEYVVLTVSDTGHGIAPEDLPRIFEPFYSTKAQGRGLGLAACMGIARAHRGWLEVTSERGVGTTFSLLLPLPREPLRRPSRPPPATASTFAGATVLLIDDEPAVRAGSTRLLEELGCRVLVCPNGATGAACFAREHSAVDVVLLDLTMPEQSGTETLTRLRDVDPGVRVVFTSGFHPQDVADLLREPGVTGFLEKPHRLATLTAALQRALQTPRATPTAP